MAAAPEAHFFTRKLIPIKSHQWPGCPPHRRTLRSTAQAGGPPSSPFFIGPCFSLAASLLHLGLYLAVAFGFFCQPVPSYQGGTRPLLSPRLAHPRFGSASSHCFTVPVPSSPSSMTVALLSSPLPHVRFPSSRTFNAAVVPPAVLRPIIASALSSPHVSVVEKRSVAHMC